MSESVGLPPPDEAETIAPAAAAAVRKSGDFFSLEEIQLTLLIFAFGLVSMLVFYLLIRMQGATPYVLRLYVIIILVFGTLLVVSSSYSTSQIAPVVGFFGTIAGYLVGKSEKRDGQQD